MQQQVSLNNHSSLTEIILGLHGNMIRREHSLFVFPCQWWGGEDLSVRVHRSWWYRSWWHWQTSWITHSKSVSTASAHTATLHRNHKAGLQRLSPHLISHLRFLGSGVLVILVSASVPAYALKTYKLIPFLACLKWPDPKNSSSFNRPVEML